MDINFEKGVVTLYGKNIKLDPLNKRLSLLSGEQVYHFLHNRGIRIPRIFNCYALMSVLNEKIKFLHSKSLSKDYFQRLQYYRYFTEQQLFNLFTKICNDEMSFYKYRYNFFRLILLNFVGMNLNDGEITYLKNLKKGSMESFEEYYNYISSVSLEQEGSFDGRSIADLKEMLPLSASNQDIFDLAGKYGIDLPTRLKKQQFLDFIFYYLKKKNQYNEDTAEELEDMTIAQLTTYARRTGIPMQPAMSKNDLVTYLFYYLEQCQIEYTSIKRIELSDEFYPLEFTIDFSQINAFATDATKVVHYAGEEEDQTQFDEVLSMEDVEDEEYIEEEKPEEASKEANENVNSNEPTPIPVPLPLENNDKENPIEENPIEESPVEESPIEEATEEETLVTEPEDVENTTEELKEINPEDITPEEIDRMLSEGFDEYEPEENSLEEKEPEALEEAKEEILESQEPAENTEAEKEKPEEEPIETDWSQDYNVNEEEEVSNTPELTLDDITDDLTVEQIQALAEGGSLNEEKVEEEPDFDGDSNDADEDLDSEDKSLEKAIANENVFDDVRKNEYLNDKKIMKYAKGGSKKWIAVLIVAAIIVVAGILVYMEFLKK